MFDELKKEINSDLFIDPTQLETCAANNPICYGKYSMMASETRRHVRAAELKLDRVKYERLMVYTGRHDTEVPDVVYERSELKFVLAQDERIQKAEAELFLYENKLQLLKDACESFKQRGFAIKHMIDIRLFESGK